ncbi:MAG: PrsW family glutamic-type intramembrane protease [Mariniphaga sp.]
MEFYIISYLITIVFWIWMIRKYDKFEKEPLLSVLFVFAIGGLISSFPAGIFNSLFGYVINFDFGKHDAVEQGVAKSALFYGFVGINEEFCKALATVWLIRKSRDFNEPADALVYSMTLAFGFSLFENIDYTLRLGIASFFIRQFNAVPLHIGLAAIWGIGMAKAKFLHSGKYLVTMAPYILGASFLHFVYNFAPKLIESALLSLIVPISIAFFLIRFALMKIRQYAEDGPYSNQLYCRHCDTPNLLIARVCKTCGEKFHLEFYDLCQNCNTKVDKEAKFCPNCGFQLKKETTDI